MQSFYQQFHPLTKQAGKYNIPTALTDFLKTNWKNLRAKLNALKQPQYYRDMITQYRPTLISGTFGGIAGGYLGNQAFNNSLPPVRALPDIQQSPLLEVEKPYGRSN